MKLVRHGYRVNLSKFMVVKYWFARRQVIHSRERDSKEAGSNFGVNQYPLKIMVAMQNNTRHQVVPQFVTELSSVLIIRWEVEHHIFHGNWRQSVNMFFALNPKVLLLAGIKV